MNTPDPGRYGETSVLDLLRNAARGRIGVDRRMIRSILERQPSAAADVLAFAREPHERDAIGLDPLLVDLFRTFQMPEALDYFIDAIRRHPDDIEDPLIEALLPYGAAAVDSLLKLYEELGEEAGSDVAFLLSGLRVHDPRVREILLERLEFDAADGAFCLGLYGDQSTRPALEAMLAEIPESETDLRREIAYALEQIDAPAPNYEASSFDILAEYPEHEDPAFEVLTEPERLEYFQSPDALTRAGAARSFFNSRLDPKAKAALLDLAQSDADPKVRGRAWESLGDVSEEDAIRDGMLAVLRDASRPVEERGGAGVGLYAVADRDDAREAIEALYAEGGQARAKALEAMWRSLWRPYAKYFMPHLDDTDIAIVREAIRGAGYFQIPGSAERIGTFFDREGDFADLREDAIFAYALAMPGETTRGRVRGMLRKLDALAGLNPDEADIAMFALDERLRMKNLEPVFASEGEIEEEEEAPAAAPAPTDKPGRNDPCPCGSGKKYKKCHGQ